MKTIFTNLQSTKRTLPSSGHHYFCFSLNYSFSLCRCVPVLHNFSLLDSSQLPWSYLIYMPDSDHPHLKIIFTVYLIKSKAWQLILAPFQSARPNPLQAPCPVGPTTIRILREMFYFYTFVVTSGAISSLQLTWYLHSENIPGFPSNHWINDCA